MTLSTGDVGWDRLGPTCQIFVLRLCDDLPSIAARESAYIGIHLLGDASHAPTKKPRDALGRGAAFSEAKDCAYRPASPGSQEGAAPSGSPPAPFA
jgi:hypothetical protein